ncbi:TPA: hypothetical protein ACH3X1_007195 [Trebouxia sp. C0004]
MGCGAPADVQGNSANNIGQNNSLHQNSQGTITCPAGSYAYGTFGQSGKSVDSISGLKCRNIFDGTTSTVNQGGFGGGGGKASTNPIDCGGSGLAGFWTYTNNNTNLDGLGGICRPLGNGSRTDVGLNGTSGGTCGTVHRYTGDTSRLVNSVTGATSNNNVVANFGYNTLNFSTIAGYGGNSQAGAACCAGQDSSAECASGRGGGLNCSSTLQNYCSQGDRIYSDGICKAALGNGALDGTWAKNQQLAWCQQGSNFNTDKCKNSCTASTGENSTQKEACNTLYANQCTQPANKNLDICSCSLNWSDYPTDITAGIDKITGAPHEPMCYFSQCAKNGYLKTTKDKLACPACIQSQNIDITNSTASLKNISQSCNVSTNTSSSTAATNTAASSTPSGGATSATTTAASVTPAPVAPVVTAPAATATAAATATTVSAASITSIGNGSIGGNLAIGGATTLQTVAVAGPAAFTSSVSVSGPLSVNSLTASGLTALQDNTAVGGSLQVAGAAVLQQSLTCGPLTALAANVTNDLVVGSNIYSTGITASGGAALGSLTVIGNSTLNTLSTASTASFWAGASITNDLTVGGGLLVSGATGIRVPNGKLSLSGVGLTATSSNFTLSVGGSTALAIDANQNLSIPSGSLSVGSINGNNGQPLILKGADAAGTVHIAGNVVIDGDWDTANKVEMKVEDLLVTLAHSQSSPKPDSVADGAGIQIEGSSGFAKSIIWKNNLGLAYNGTAGSVPTNDGLSYFQVQGGNLMLTRRQQIFDVRHVATGFGADSGLVRFQDRRQIEPTDREGTRHGLFVASRWWIQRYRADGTGLRNLPAEGLGRDRIQSASYEAALQAAGDRVLRYPDP